MWKLFAYWSQSIHPLFNSQKEHQCMGCQSYSTFQQTKAKIEKFCLSSTPLLKPFCLVAMLIAIDIQGVPQKIIPCFGGL